MAKRFRDGALDLEVPETVLVIDDAGEPIDVIKSERLFAHRLIEELMLAANVAVAKFLGSREVPSFYRVHEAPDVCVSVLVVLCCSAVRACIVATAHDAPS